MIGLPAANAMRRWPISSRLISTTSRTVRCDGAAEIRGQTDPQNFGKPRRENAAAAILAANPNLLIFVEGTNANLDGRERAGIPITWGENFQPEAYLPLDIPADKPVLFGHTLMGPTYT